MLTKLARLVVIVGAAGTGFWLVRNRIFPPPTMTPDPAPIRAAGPRPAPPPTPESRSDDDVTQINGIGKAYASRLAEHGVTTVADLARVEPAAMASALGLGESTVAGWVEQARTGTS